MSPSRLGAEDAFAGVDHAAAGDEAAAGHATRLMGAARYIRSSVRKCVAFM
jgi:hypothetical protein